MTIKRVNEHEFQTDLQTQGITLVDFDAPWCPPCKVLSPILEQLHEELGGTVDVLKVNCDDNPALASKYGIMSMPTVILFNNGEPSEKLVGLRPKDVYKQLIAKYEDLNS